MQSIRKIAALGAAAAFGAALTCCRVAHAQDRGQPWQKYHDPNFHLALDYPQGWNVHVDSHAILIRSEDNAAFALIENFAPASDETPEDHVDALPSTESQFFRSAHVDSAYTEPAKSGNEKEESGVGALSFFGARGPAQARVLCRIYPSGGIMFAIAAPRGQLATASPTLLHILQSINFGAPGMRSGSAQPERSESGGVAAAAPLGLDPITNVKYKHWVDPKEAAFSYDVPVGWKVDGGSYRYAPLDVRQSIIVRSPHDEMAFLLGDASLPTFTIPSMSWTRLGYRDGAVQNVVGKPMFFMHYMSADDFNHWYFDNIFKQNIDDLVVGETTDNPEAAKQMMDAMNKPGMQGQAVYSIAGTAFNGRSKLNGRPMAGILFTATSEYIGNAQGDGNWTAHPQIAVYATGDSKENARKEFLAAVKKHVNGSFQFSKDWIAKQNQIAIQFLAANRAATNNALAMGRASMASMARSHQAYMSAQDDRRTSMMGSFRAQMAAKDENRRKELNYIGDTTDVTNGGTSWKVPSGYNSYYHNARTGTIVGTNDPSNPGPDFTPLTQH